MFDFVISDTHFNHARIPEYEPVRRTWGATPDTAGMTEAMITAWNHVVKPDHSVLHLGDFMLGPKVNWAATRARLNGRIVLVRGNHDPSPGSKHWAHLHPVEVHEHLSFTDPVMGLVCCRHDPFEFTVEEMLASDVLLHGHLHSGGHREGTPPFVKDKAFCLSVERLSTQPAPMEWKLLQDAYIYRTDPKTDTYPLWVDDLINGVEKKESRGEEQQRQ